MAAEIGEIWENIHTWLEKNAPKTLANLNGGATLEQIKELEEQCNIQLPEDFKASLEIHNGGSSTLFNGLEFMTIEEIVTNWKMMKDMDETSDFNEIYKDDTEPSQFQHKWWVPEWIFFARHICGDFLMIDLAPSDTGTLGQVAYWDHEGSEVDWKASNFTEYLKKFLADLEGDEYALDSDSELYLKSDD